MYFGLCVHFLSAPSATSGVSWTDHHTSPWNQLTGSIAHPAASFTDTIHRGHHFPTWTNKNEKSVTYFLSVPARTAPPIPTAPGPRPAVLEIPDTATRATPAAVIALGLTPLQLLKHVAR